MSQLKHVGPITVEVAPGHGPEGEKLGVSPTYRNLAAVDELPTQLDGSSTLFEVFESSVSKFGDRPCLGWRPVSDDGQAGPYQFLTYIECREKARALASSLSQCGVARGGKIGVYSANSVNWMVAIRAADALSAAIVPIYDSLGESAVEYIVKHSELTVALVETSKLVHFAKVAPSIADQVKHVVVMDGSKLPSAASSALDTIKGAGLSVHTWEEFLRLGVGTGFKPEPPKPEDVACIMYTSGTTGTPKGVLLSHKNLVSGVSGALHMINQSKLGLGPKDSMLSYLPLAHVYGRILEEVVLSMGGHIGYWRGREKKEGEGGIRIEREAIQLLGGGRLLFAIGTTGTPKGVLINQRALVAGVAGAHTMLKQSGIAINNTDSMISYLPLAHIFGRIIEEFALSVGGSIGYWQGNVKLLMDDLTALKPTLFVAVPRILERVCDAVEDKLAKGPSIARMAFHAAFNYKLFMLRQGISHWASGFGVDQLIFKRIRQATGGRVRFIISGGAPLSAHVEDFCNVCLAPVLQGYGLTETCAASFIMLPDPRLAHTVGPPLTPTEFRLESVPELKYDATESPPKGEICIRGPMVFSGYYKDAKKTEEALDKDGWFHTGDIGTLTPQGCLKIIDRKKNIFKLAQGEYIAVEYLESKYSRSDAVEQIWVYGNSHESSLVAVVVPKPHWIEKFSNGTADEDARKSMVQELNRVGKEAKLKGFEAIRAVYLDEEQFGVENDLMTPSMKLKRPQLQQKYQQEIDAMYASLKSSKK